MVVFTETIEWTAWSLGIVSIWFVFIGGGGGEVWETIRPSKNSYAPVEGHDLITFNVNLKSHNNIFASTHR